MTRPKAPLPLTIVYASLCAVVALCADGRVFAGEFSAAASPRRPCVLLVNDHVLFGTASQEGDWVVVRREAGATLRLPREQVACWGQSLRDLYQYRADHRTRLTPSNRIEEARWCLNHRLFHCASREIEAARAMIGTSPDPHLRRRLDALEQRLIGLMTVDPDVRVASHTSGSEADTVIAATATASTPTEPSLSLAPSSLKDFTAAVQPILINRCGSCHGVPNASDFRIQLPVGGVRATRQITRRNVEAVLRVVTSATSSERSLLAMAITPHGGGAAGLGPSDMKAISAIKQWSANMRVIDTEADRHVNVEAGNSEADQSATVRGGAQNDGNLRAPTPPNTTSARRPLQSGAAVVQHDAPEHSVTQASAISGAASPGFVRPAAAWSDAASPGLPDRRAAAVGVAEPRPKRLPPVTNPHDPDLFNRRFHGAAARIRQP